MKFDNFEEDSKIKNILVKQDTTTNKYFPFNTPPDKISFHNDKLFLDNFKFNRKCLDYLLLIHCTVNFSFFINYKYPTKEHFFKDKMNVFKYCIYIYMIINISDDLVYSLFKKHPEDGIFRQFINYEKKMFEKVKNIDYKNIIANNLLIKNKISNNNDKLYKINEIDNTHDLLKELEKINQLYEEKKENLSYLNNDYITEYNNLQVIKNKKREIEKRIIEIKNLNVKLY